MGFCFDYDGRHPTDEGRSIYYFSLNGDPIPFSDEQLAELCSTLGPEAKIYQKEKEYVVKFEVPKGPLGKRRHQFLEKMRLLLGW